MINAYGSLGAGSTEADAQAWSAYVSAANADVQAAWAAAKTSYLTLKSVRAKLGLPFITSTSGEGGGGDTGGWSDDLDVQAKDLQAMAKVLDDAAKDAASGKRKMNFDPKTGTLSIGGLSSDVVRIEADANGVPVLVNVASGYPIHVDGAIGAVPVLLVGAAAAGVAVQSVGLYLLAKQAMRTLETVSEHKTMRTLSNNQTEQIKDGATPAEAKANTDAIYQGAVALNKAQAEKAKAGNDETNKLADTAVKIGYLALIGGALYIAAGVISRLPTESFTRRAPAHLLLNPRMRMPQRGYGYVTPASNWRTTSDEHWDIEIVDDLIIQELLGTRSLDGVTVDVWRALRRLPGGRNSQVFVAQTTLGKA